MCVKSEKLKGHNFTDFGIMETRTVKQPRKLHQRRHKCGFCGFKPQRVCVCVRVCECECVRPCVYLQLVGVVEADVHGRNHPGLKESAQDLIGHGVGDEVEVKRVPPGKQAVAVGSADHQAAQ